MSAAASTDEAIGREILRQLGGARALAMLGATKPGHVLLTPTGVQIKLGRGARRKATHLAIDVSPLDTYTLTLTRYSRPARECIGIARWRDIYAGNLRHAVECLTELRLSL